MLHRSEVITFNEKADSIRMKYRQSIFEV
ncbi:hypothetical protein ACFQ3O_02750 [Alkalibacillus flavidus]